MSKRSVTIFLAALCGACAHVQDDEPTPTAYAPAHAALTAQAEPLPGTIFRDGSGVDLFMDLRARAVGDILTVRLVERTNASKESSTSTARGASVDTGFPVIAGRPVTVNGTQVFNNELASDSSFSGQADASQSNSLDGNITVTVTQRLPNGNLHVRGEKWITLNQGEELIRVEGIVRPVDIGPDNTIDSTKVADARITYSGKGTLADANRPGWLSRFFNSPWFPF